MKKQLLTIALLAGALTASAGVNLVVSGQQQQSFAVGDIGKITFTESTMDVYGKDSGKIGTFSLSDITKLFFSDKEGNVTEINPDGALKFAKTGNTLKVDGLSAAPTPSLFQPAAASSCNRNNGTATASTSRR